LPPHDNGWSMRRRWKAAAIWSTVATLVIMGLQVLVDSRAPSVSVNDVTWWLLLWPIFFLAIWILTSWRELYKQGFELGADWEARRAAAGPTPPVEAVCPRCGFANAKMAVHCTGCGLLLKQIEVVHVVELLPGARQSVPSALYVVAIVGSFCVGGLTLALIGQERFLDNDVLMIGGFMGGTTAALLLFLGLLRLWVHRRAGRL
jgi:hypothetical protein